MTTTTTTWTLGELRTILEALDFEEIGPGGMERTDALRALALLDRVAAEVGEWVACLSCGAAFPTNDQLTSHYWSTHRR